MSSEAIGNEKSSREWRNSLGLRRGYSIAALIAGACLLVPSSALAGQAYLLADQPLSASYSPTARYSYNSSGLVNQVARVATGTYRVTFPGVGDVAAGGNVQVSTYGDVTNRCKIFEWFATGTNVQVDVRCFDRFGARVDQRFTALFAQYYSPTVAMSGMTVHFLADSPLQSAWYSPSSLYHYHSGGGQATVRRRSLGAYEVRVHTPFLFRRDPVINVTAQGADDAYCSVDDKFGENSINEYSFYIGCRNSAGARIDSKFSTSMLLETTAVPKHRGAYVQALYFDPWSSAATLPSIAYGSDPTLVTVVVPGLDSSGTVIVNGGVHGYYCNVIGWGPPSSLYLGATLIDVRCRDRNHVPVRMDFDLQFLSKKAKLIKFPYELLLPEPFPWPFELPAIER